MNLKEIISNLGITEDIIENTNPIKKPKYFTKVKDNIPLIESYNYMADLLMLPEDKKGFKYLLVIVDLGNNEFDIEALKNKTSKAVLAAMQTIFNRKYLDIPKASMSTDDGSELKDVFNEWLVKHKIYHKVAIAGRHSQQANVESLNKQLGYLFNLYMNMKEKDTQKVYREWTDIIDIVRRDLNKVRKTPNQSISSYDYPSIDIDAEAKFKVGDIVLHNSEVPLNALGKKQSTTNFRQGDYRYNVEARKVLYVLPYAGKVPFRYVLEGLPNVSFTENQLLLSNEKETKYIVKKIIDKKKIKNKIHYLVWWQKEKKADATWEPKDNLIEDGLQEYIDEFENR